MTEDELKEIEAKYESVPSDAPWWTRNPAKVVLALIAEVRSLQNEIENLNTHIGEMKDAGFEDVNDIPD